MSDEEDNAPAETTDPVKILEGLLRRFQLLNGTVSAFHREVASIQPLPPYAALMTRINAMRDSAAELVAELNNHKELLNARVVTPAPQFAAKYHVDFLGNLFRTKMEPNVEDWEQQHLKIALDKENKQDREKKDGNLSILSDRDRRDLWQWALDASQRQAMRHDWFNADYTRAETEAGIENVVHGLKRDLVVPQLPDNDDDDEEDEDEDDFEDVDVDEPDAGTPDKMDLDNPKPEPPAPAAATIEEPSKPVRPPLPMDKILRFTAKGEMP